MADKSISQLPEATQVNAADMFVLEQSSTAKKLTGQTLENWLLSYADGHGGIQSITKQSTAGLVDTYRITLADTTTIDFTVTNGKGVSGVTKQSTAGLVDTYRITYTDGTYSTFTVTNGEKGDKGDQTYVWIRWSAVENPTDADIGIEPDVYIGIYAGTASTAPTTAVSYKWYKYKGEQGNPGTAAQITEQNVHYAVSISGTTAPAESWSVNVPPVSAGRYLWTRTTIKFNTGDPVVSYSVARMGIDGTGAVSSVNNISPDENGNVAVSAGDIETESGETVEEKLAGCVVPSELLDLIYPVGSVYMTLSATEPGAIFGGRWARIKDVFLLAAGDTYQVSNATKDGGEAEVTLNITQIPAHTHTVSFNDQDQGGGTTARRLNSNGEKSITSGASGGGMPHNNMPPYKVVNVWQRLE